MDPSWRIKKRHGRGASRLILGFSRRAAPLERLGLRVGLRRFGRELPRGGPLYLAIFCGVSVVGLSTFWAAVDSESDLLISYLDSDAPAAKTERPISAIDA